jgi:hypothetical protein
MLKDRFTQQAADHKVNVVQAISENKARDADFRANVGQAETVNKNLNKDFRANQVQAESENRDRSRAEVEAERAEKQQAKEEARAERAQQSAAERAQAKAERARIVADNAATKADQAKQKEAAKAELAKAKVAQQAAKEAAKLEAAKLKALNAAIRNAEPKQSKVSKVTGEQPQAEPKARQPYEPLLEEELYPKGITPEKYADLELAAYEKPGYSAGAKLRYKSLARGSERVRQETFSDLKERFPGSKHAFDGLHRQLQKIGANKEMRDHAVAHYADLLNDGAAAKALREAFK